VLLLEMFEARPASGLLRGDGGERRKSVRPPVVMIVTAGAQLFDFVTLVKLG
jgi:hypothetical protein